MYKYSIPLKTYTRFRENESYLGWATENHTLPKSIQNSLRAHGRFFIRHLDLGIGWIRHWWWSVALQITSL